MEPEKRDEVRAWFQKAANDLRGADIDLAASPPLIEDALFHCQQAAEKALKGYLDELGRACETIDPSLSTVLTPARDLTVFAWEFRYPGGTTAPTEGEARHALATARAVYDGLISRLPPDVHP